MSRTKKVIASLGIFFGIILGVGLLLPQDWVVQRSVFIHAKPEAIYPYLANFKSGWTQWNVFDLGDKEGLYIYSETEEGAGAFRSWKSRKMGNGWQRMIKADPHEGIVYDLEMERRHFLIHGEMKFIEKNNGTEVLWTGSGNVGNNLFLKYLVRAMDTMMGDVYERSLENLRQKVELSDKLSA